MTFSLDEIISWAQLGGDISPVMQRLQHQEKLVVFDSDEPKLILLSVDRFREFFRESPSASTVSPNSREDLSPSIRVGAYVRGTMEQLFAQNALSQEELDKLCRLDYCREVFHIGTPVLKEIDPWRRRNEVEIHRQCVDSKGYLRYYKKVYSVKGRCFLLANGWKEHPHRAAFTAWFSARDSS